MSLRFSVVIIDRQSQPGRTRYQEMVSIGAVDMEKTVFHPTTSPKPSSSHLVLSFPIATPDLAIHELQQVWAGYQDDTTGLWATSPPPFGGYIIGLSETTYGGEKQFQLDLVDYGILLTKTTVLGWPTSEAADPYTTLIGYPPNYSVRDWLVGSVTEGKPYDGLLPSHLGNGSRFDNIDPIFSQILFTQDVLPGILDVIPGSGQLLGQFGFASLYKIIQDIADATAITYSKNYAGPELQVGFWMSAVPDPQDGTRIVPMFNYRNVADDGAAYDLIVSTDPQPDEIQMLHPHKHERDARDVVTRVVVKGVGRDETYPEGQQPLIFSDYLNPLHDVIYPTDFQVTPGWGGDPVIESRLHLLSTAQFLAPAYENRVWGAKGAIEFLVDQPIYAGQRIRLKDTNEVLDRVYVVTEVEELAGHAGYPMYRVRVGFTQPTLQDAIKGGLADVLLLYEDLSFSEGKLTQRTLTGVTKRIPIEMAPNHAQRNFITPGYSDTPALSIHATGVDRDPEHPTTTPAHSVRYFDQYGNEMDWQEHTGAAPVRLALDFPSGGTATWQADEDGIFNRMLITPSTLTVSITLRGAAVPNPTTYTPAVASGDPPVLVVGGTSLSYREGDLLAVTTTGTGQVTLSHRNARLFPV